MKIVKNISAFMLVLVLLSTFAYASDSGSGIFVKLLNQKPDPVKAGEDLELNIAIENQGDKALDNYYVQVITSYPFKEYPDESLIKKVGTILPYTSYGTSKSSDGLVVLKFKLKVEDNIKEGTYPLDIRVYREGYQQQGFTKTVYVKVDSQANAEISSINVENLVPGQKTELVFGIKNVGKSNLRNVMFSWESTDDIILPVGSGNAKYIDSVKVGETVNVSFDVISDVNTVPKLYKINLNLVYDDVEALQKITEAGTVETNKRREVNSKAGIYVGGNTEFDISFYEFNNDESTFNIANIGSNDANSVVIHLIEDDILKIEGTSSIVIGNIKKGSYTSADFKLKNLGNVEKHNVTFVVKYTDTIGNRQSFNKTLELNMNILSSSKINDVKSQEVGLLGIVKYGLLFVVLVIVGLVVFVRNKRFRAKK